MSEIILTGASRGIGRALALELGKRDDVDLCLMARDEPQLNQVAAQCRSARALRLDLGDLRGAEQAGQRLSDMLFPGATLIHNAGIWPAKRELTDDGFERAYVVNHLGPLSFQAPLLANGKLARIMVVSSGMMTAGRIDPQRTPTGEDFSAFRTYATTKRCFAEATRSLAPKHPDVDFLVIHPGVVRTDLGARRGVLGWILDLAKRRWEAPEACAARLARVLDRPRWSPPGEARWYFEEREMPWPI